MFAVTCVPPYLRSDSFLWPNMNVLVLNSGSSSLKFQVIATDLDRIRQHKDDRICRGEIEGIGGESIIRVQYRAEPAKTFTAPLRDVAAALDYLVRYIAQGLFRRPRASVCFISGRDGAAGVGGAPGIAPCHGALQTSWATR